MPRVVPLTPPFAPEAERALARWMPPGAAVPPIALFRTIAKHEALGAAMLELGRFMLGRQCAIGLREREIVIDRVCARCDCEYEWGVHVVAFGAAAGLSEAEIAATHAPGVAAVWGEREAALVELVDQLHDSGHVGDALWQRLARHFDERQRLELLVLCGWYHVIAYFANGAGVERESWARRFPERADGAARPAAAGDAR